MSAALGGVVRVGGLDGVLLARSERGDGRHRVVSARLAGRDVVVKLYGRKRPVLPTLLRSFGHRFLVGKTGLSARARRDTEARLLALWRAHGFAVPEVLALTLPEPVAEPYLVIERIDGPKVDARLRDPAAPQAELEAAVARFAAECSRRHGLAESLAEPGLVHAHASFAHLFDRRGEWTYFDFEYAYGDVSRVEQLVAVEIAGFVASLRRAAGERAAPLVRAFVAGYTDRSRLRRAAARGAVGRFRAVDAFARRLPLLRGRGPAKLRDSVAALAAELERAP
jgi:tRNA A-37 threonylcarbamoyl transferase component Bud32